MPPRKVKPDVEIPSRPALSEESDATLSANYLVVEVDTPVIAMRLCGELIRHRRAIRTIPSDHCGLTIRFIFTVEELAWAEGGNVLPDDLVRGLSVNAATSS